MKKEIAFEELDQIKTFGELPPKVGRINAQIFEEVQAVFNENVFSSHLEKYLEAYDQGMDYLKLGAFKEGYPVSNVSVRDELAKIMKSPFSSLNQMAYSVRLTNFQQVFPEVREVVNYFYREHGYGVGVNMYITPSSETSCFLYHSDYQETFIQQLQGVKKWSFPLDIKTGQWLKVINQSDLNQNPKDVVELELAQGAVLYVGHSLVHRAKNLLKNEPSIHLTYGILTPDQREMMSAFINQLFCDQKIEDLAGNKDLSYQFMAKKLAEAQDKIKSFDLEAFHKDFMEKENIKKAIMCKKGRKY